MKKTPRLLAMAITACLLGLAVGNANATAILVSDTTSTSGPVVVLSGNSFSGTEFTLTTAANITDGIAFLKIRTEPATLSDVHVTILGDNGSHAPNATLYATSTGASGTLTTTAANLIDFTFNPTILPAGTYWFEVHDTSTSGGKISWIATNSITNTGLNGTVNSFNLSPPAGSAELFQVLGTAVPEPTSFFLAGLGFAGLGFVARRKIDRRGQSQKAVASGSRYQSTEKWDDTPRSRATVKCVANGRRVRLCAAVTENQQSRGGGTF
jgi:hypothetical protein